MALYALDGVLVDLSASSFPRRLLNGKKVKHLHEASVVHIWPFDVAARPMLRAAVMRPSPKIVFRITFVLRLIWRW